jgi:hypothetical protein
MKATSSTGRAGERFDAHRIENGFLTIEEILNLVVTKNVVHDPFSLLISRGTTSIGKDNTFYPCCVLNAENGGHLEVGNNNRFGMATLVEALGSSVHIGSGNQFGDGGFTLRADRIGASVKIGDRGRYTGGVRIYGSATLGNGSQVHGNIVLIDCELVAGMDASFPDPNARGGVLKGFGTARELVVGAGEVIAGAGVFSQDELRRQREFHP